MNANANFTEVKQIIKTASLILIGFVVLGGGSILYLWFGMLKPYTQRSEKPRVPLLKKIAAAQSEFRIQDLDNNGIQDYGSLKELIKAKLLTDREAHKAGFVFSEPATSDPKNRWWAVAQPLHPSQGRSFFINHTGIIHYSTDAPWDLESGINRKTAEVPAGAQVMKEP